MARSIFQNAMPREDACWSKQVISDFETRSTSGPVTLEYKVGGEQHCSFEAGPAQALAGIGDLKTTAALSVGTREWFYEAPEWPSGERAACFHSSRPAVPNGSSPAQVFATGPTLRWEQRHVGLERGWS